MNPFIKDPVAQPLGEHARECWAASPPSRVRQSSRFSKRAGAAMIAAGLAIGLPAQALDVNTASISQLESLRGIGPRTAKMIVQERTRAGAFASMEDLSDRVRGLGERRVRALRQAGLDVHTGSSSAALSVSQQNRGSSGKASHNKSSHNKASHNKSQSMLAKPEVIAPESL